MMTATLTILRRDADGRSYWSWTRLAGAEAAFVTVTKAKTDDKTVSIKAAVPGATTVALLLDTTPALRHRQKIYAQVVARGGRVPPAWWQADGVCATVAEALASRSFCILDEFLATAACNELWKEVRTADRAGKLQDANATIGGGGQMYAQANEHRASALRNDRIGWFTGSEAGWRMLPAYLQTVDHLLSMLRQCGVAAAADVRSCTQRSRAMVACYPGGGARYTRHCDNVCHAGSGAACNGRRLTAIFVRD